MSFVSQYCFTTCKVGAEAALKAEIARVRPAWHPAFARPGLVSFKLPSPVGAEHRLAAMFPHAYGFSAGNTSQAETPDAVFRFLDTLDLDAARLPRLHCFARQVFDTRDTPSPMEPAARDLALALAGSGRFANDPVARDGDWVVDVVVVDADRVLYGAHVHHVLHSPFPGGMPPLELPPEAPSRAWLKLEEALPWHWERLRPGQVAVEIGSAPGGTAWGLLARGATVIAVDPAAMDPRVAAARHIRKPAAALLPGDLPEAIDWLLVDINDNPGATVRLALQIAARSTRRPAMLLTLKLADWALAAEVPASMARLRRAGFPRVAARQLAHGRREIVLLA